MKGFEDITLSWAGEDYTIPARKVFDLIFQVERIIRGSDRRQAVEILLQPGGPDIIVLARAYGAALRYAGADVTDEHLYFTVHEAMAEGSAEAALQFNAAIIGVLAIISPPTHRKFTAIMNDDAEKTEPMTGA